MKTTTKSFKRLFVTTLFLIAMACSKNDDGSNPDLIDPPLQTIAEVIANGNEFEDYPESETVNELSEEPPYNEDYERTDTTTTYTQRFICTKKRVSIEDGSKDFFLFNPNSSIIYPGNLLQGKTLDDATPESIPLKRGPGVISYNIIDGNQSSSVSVDEISLSAVRDAQNEIIAGSIADGDPSVPAKFTLTVEEVQSKEELAWKLGVKFKTFNAKISGGLSVDTSTEVNSVMVKLVQEYYTMDVDVPTSPDAFFDESVTPERLAEYVQADNPATYISQVTYGRIFYMLFQSTSSEHEMRTKLDLGYDTIGNSTEGSVEFDSFNSLSNLSLQVIAYGGDSAETLDAVGNFTNNESIGNFLSQIGKSSDITTGLPLSYVVNSVERPSKIVGAKLATEFDLITCELKGTIPPNLYKGLVDLFDNGIGAMFQVRDSDIIVFSKEGNKYAWFNGNAGTILGDGQPAIFDIKDPDAPLGTLVLDGIGSAMHMFGETVVLTDLSGTLLQTFTIDPNLLPSTGTLPNVPIGAGSPNTQPVNLIFGNRDNYQIGTFGVEALVRVGEVKSAFFAKPGDFYQIYETTDNVPWTETYDSTKWFVDRTDATTQGGTVFERVGAVARFSLGFSGNDPKRYLFVNEAGNEIMEWFAGGDDEDRIEGPWVIN